MATTAKSSGENNEGLALMGARDAARLLGLSNPALEQWIYKGKIPTIKAAAL
jgi:DNA-binding transcriptional regulator YdaS (Cro superfamily)